MSSTSKRRWSPQRGGLPRRSTDQERPLVEVADLTVRFRINDHLRAAVDGVTFHIDAGEKVALVGESGSGKSVTGLALTRLGDRRGAKIDPTSSIRIGDVDVTAASEQELIRLRRSVASMVFQDPLGALNPMYSVGEQVGEAVRLCSGGTRSEIREGVLELLGRVGLPDTKRVASSYPHQLSGGMRQRVMIAIAMASTPQFIIADEPTTALDPTVQTRVIEQFNQIVDETGISILFISHDLSLVGSFVDRVLVMYAGRIVEQGPVSEIFERPAHPYTRALLRSVPTLANARQSDMVGIPGAPPRIEQMPSGCRFHPRCDHAVEECQVNDPMPQRVSDARHRAACHRMSDLPPFVLSQGRPREQQTRLAGARQDEALVKVTHLTKTFGGRSRRGRNSITAVDDVSLDVHQGEALGIVGESGSGKSTLALLMAGLEKPDNGSVSFDGHRLEVLSRGELRSLRRDLQIVFQDPTASLNPRLTVRSLLSEPFAVHRMELDKATLHDRLGEALRQVGLDPKDLSRYPREFSGGQRQRIAIARALVLDPKLLILDEPVSSLDVSVQAEIVALLQRLRSELALSYVFIAHDLALVRSFCDRVVVMKDGAVVESGTVGKVMDDPDHEYTRELINSIPVVQVGG